MEVWIPDRERTSLHFQAGFYRGGEPGSRAALPVRVARGQGLAGQVLLRKAPMILEDLTLYRGFVRPEVAARSGFSAGVGLPVLHGEEVEAVVTLLFAASEAGAGAFEIWRCSPDGTRMEWEDGFYGEMQAFEALSRATTFARGVGLPGQVLAARMPVLFESLSGERGFVRAGAAAAAGLSAGLGIPVLDADGVRRVLLLLTSAATPMARVMEIWQPGRDGTLRLTAGYYGRLSAFEAVSRATTFEPGVGLPGRVFADRMPVVFERLTREAGFVRCEAAARAGLEAAIGFPVLEGDAARAVVVLFN